MAKHYSSYPSHIHQFLVIGIALAIPAILPVASEAALNSKPTVRPAVSPTVRPTVSPIAAETNGAAQRKAIAEQFFDLLFSGRYYAASTYITPVMQSDFSPSALQQKVITFERGAGAFVKRGDAQVQDDIVLIDIQFQRRTVTFIVSFDQNLKIAGANPVIGFIGDETPSSNPSSPNQSVPQPSPQGLPNQSAPNQASPNQQPR
jgi:hypothetical protein